MPYFDAKLNVEEHVLALALGLAKLQRNLIAGLYDFQAATRYVALCASSQGCDSPMLGSTDKQTARTARQTTAVPLVGL